MESYWKELLGYKYKSQLLCIELLVFVQRVCILFYYFIAYDSFMTELVCATMDSSINK